MLKKILFFILLCCNTIAEAQPPAFTIYLLGDAGNCTTTSTLFKSYKAMLDSTSNSASIILGDNIYPKGMLKNSKKSYLDECKKINTQLEMATDYDGYFFVIPGNHDWRAGKWNGIKSVKEQKKYVDSVLLNNSKIVNKRNTFLPSNALPGPEYIDINNTIRIIFIDTQWWLQSVNLHGVPRLENTTKKETEDHFFIKLDSLIEDANQRNINVVAAFHHPVLPSGVHEIPKWILFAINYTPFQLLGILGGNRILSQTSNQLRYKKMTEKLMKSFEKSNQIVLVSGHEHILFYKQKNKVKQLVVGAGSKHSTKKITTKEGIFYKGGALGFAKIVLHNATIQVSFFDEMGNVIYEEK